MRTKQTGGKSISNGSVKKTPQPSSTSAKTEKSPAPPGQLSKKDEENLRHWLNRSDKPFSVVTVPLSRKRKRNPNALSVEDNLFEDRLSVQYEIKPRDKWDSLRKFKRFTVSDEAVNIGQCVIVKHDESNETRVNVAEQWKAKVLEVRALDGEHVYIRVAWLNRPEDLDSGRKPYHGLDELIPTNQMDIIDAMAINGTLDVVHYDDTADDSALVRDQYFWRQTFDYVNTKTFSKLRPICVDAQPINPDELIIQCSNEACRQWLHVKCIAENAVQQAADARTGKNSAKKKGRPKSLKIAPTSPAVARAQKGTLTSEVYIKDLPDDPHQSGVTPATESKIVVTDADGEQTEEDLCCLFCNGVIED